MNIIQNIFSSVICFSHDWMLPITGNDVDSQCESSMIQCPNEVAHQSLSHVQEGHKLGLA
jgi:hypothetical protein